jgi:hypothetical protein
MTNDSWTDYIVYFTDAGDFDGEGNLSGPIYNNNL